MVPGDAYRCRENLFPWITPTKKRRLHRLERRCIIWLRALDKTESAKSKARFLEIDERWKTDRERELYAAVGQGLSAWAHLETSLVIITGMLLGTDFSKAGIIIYSVINFNVKLSIITELFAVEPRYSALKPQWNKKIKRLRQLNDTRDRLAHHTAQGSRTFLDDDISLRPGQLDTRDKSQKYQPLDHNQIIEFIFSVSRVTQNLTVLVDAMTEILRQETLRQKSPEQGSGQHHP